MARALAQGFGRPSAGAGRSEWALAWLALRRDALALTGLIGFGAIIATALLAPWLAPYDPTAITYDRILEPPGAAHWFGTDDLGRDIFSRVLWGGRESLAAGLLSVGIALVGGVALGLVSGYYGGWLDTLVQRLSEVVMAFPLILLLLSIVAILGPGLLTVMLAIGLAQIPSYTRLVRGAVLGARSLEYVTAAKAVGVPEGAIMLRHVLPNILGPVIVYGTLDLGFAILTTSALSYIGLGAQPPSPEWGAMLNSGREFLYEAWWMSVFPGLPIFLSVLCINLLGDGLRDALDPRARK